MSSSRINLLLAVIFGLTLPLSVVLSTHLARQSFEKVKLRDQTITVKGYAERRITSDRATWYASIEGQASDLKQAYAQVAIGREKLYGVLKDLQVTPEMVDAPAAAFSTLYKVDEKGNRTNQIESYRVSQSFHMESTDVKLLQKVSQGSSELIRDGVEINSSSPQYHYTRMDDIKLKMLGEASANARARAELLIGQGSGKLGALKSASQGVFQITSPLTTDVSDEGINDTASIDKVIKAVVTLEYAIDS